jgi:hypothetical protein
MHLEGSDGGGQDGYMGFQSTVAAFHIPEFLKSDVRAEPAFSHVIIEKLKTNAVCNDG